MGDSAWHLIYLFCVCRCHNWLSQLALRSNVSSVPGTLHTIHLDLLPPLGHALGKKMLHGTGTVAGEAADDAEHCHEHERQA